LIFDSESPKVKIYQKRNKKKKRITAMRRRATEIEARLKALSNGGLQIIALDPKATATDAAKRPGQQVLDWVNNNKPASLSNDFQAKTQKATQKATQGNLHTSRNKVMTILNTMS
jgi:uncharacterized protein YbaP (TraB family)